LCCAVIALYSPGLWPGSSAKKDFPAKGRGWADENRVESVHFGLVCFLHLCCACGPVVPAQRLDEEFRMDATAPKDGKVKYKTPRWVQAWFLGRSRERWKQKYKELKVEAKRLQNRVADVTKSREKWRSETEQLRQQVHELQAQTAALREQAAALKKDGPDAGS
jgi:hypothetical protein